MVNYRQCLFLCSIHLINNLFDVCAFVPSQPNILEKKSITIPTVPSTNSALRIASTSNPIPNVAGDSQASKQNAFGVFSDTVTGVLFSLLHAFDDCGIKDSSKNLRVLWVRALLNYRGKIKDDVAMRLLPSSTRILVTSETGAKLLDPILKFAEWIQSRTEFIDER